MLHAAIRTVTDQPVVQVINTGGQDHRWLGNGYWQAQGATVIASEAAIADHRARADDHMIALSQFLGEGLSGTEPAYADVTFEADYTLEFGGLTFEIMHRGATDLATAMSDTYDYLMNLRTQIGALIEVLAGRNAQATYEEMERE